jgi:tyrosine-protein phosphatase YwqE
VELHLAAENMLDNLFEKRLEEGDLLPLGDRGDHLLVETSYFNPPMGFYDILERIKTKGYHPVLAHPERYVYMGTAEYPKLKEMGVKFQLNLPSVAGMYGRSVQKKAEKLLKTHSYDLVGTDIHRVGLVQLLSEIKTKQKFLPNGLV